MNINFEKFLQDINMTQEEYFEINPSFKYLVDNYSTIATDSENMELVALKDGTAITEEEAIEKVRSSYTFINSIINPSDEVITASICRYPSSIKFLSEDKQNIYAELAVTQDCTALKYIKNQTAELVDFAIDRFPEAIYYAREEFKTFDRGIRVILECKNAHIFLIGAKPDEIVNYLLNTNVQNKLLHEVDTFKRIPPIFNRNNLLLIENREELRGFMQSYREKVMR